MFITESIRMFAASAASLISSAFRSSGSVGTCATSKPTSRASLKRSAVLSFAGNISNQTPFLIESVGGKGGGAEDAACELANAPWPKLAAQTAVAEDFKNSRRDGRRISSPQCSLFKSIFGSHTSLD